MIDTMQLLYTVACTVVWIKNRTASHLINPRKVGSMYVQAHLISVISTFFATRTVFRFIAALWLNILHSNSKLFYHATDFVCFSSASTYIFLTMYIPLLLKM